MPVVMLSARSGEEAAVEGLEAGADDYLVKPFTARELHARVRANLELDRVRRVATRSPAAARCSTRPRNSRTSAAGRSIWPTTGSSTSPEFQRIFGLPADHLDVADLDDALHSVRDGDRAALVGAIRRTAATGDTMDLEVRLDRADGDERLVRVRGRVYRGPDGTAEYVRGSTQDITDQRAAEQAVTAATRRARPRRASTRSPTSCSAACCRAGRPAPGGWTSPPITCPASRARRPAATGTTSSTSAAAAPPW